MKTIIREQGAQVRCYECGSDQVTEICHHCNQPICSAHKAQDSPFQWFMVNREFNRLPLGKWPIPELQGAHCANCAHGSPNYWRLMILPGLILLLVGIALAIPAFTGLNSCLIRLPGDFQPGIPALAEILRDPDAYTSLGINQCYPPEVRWHIWSTARAVLVMIVGLAASIVGFYLNREQITAKVAAWQPRIPLGPITNGIEIIEQMQVQISSAGAGLINAEILGDIRGTIQPSFFFTAADLERIRAFRRKYGEQSHGDFSAGYLLLKGQADRQLEDSKVLPGTRANLMVLQGAIQDHPYLRAGLDAADPSYAVAWSYAVSPRTEDQHLSWGEAPIRVIPMPAALGNDRALQIKIQCNTALFPEFPIDQAIFFEEICLQFDGAVFERPRASGMVTHDSQENLFQIRYQGFQLDPQDNNKILHGTLPGTVEFPHPIPQDAVITGTLRLHIPSLYSELAGIQYFNALGHPIAEDQFAESPYQAKMTTMIEVELELPLSMLPQTHQTILSLAPILAPGHNPDEKLIRKILDDLRSTGAIFPDRVIEEPQQYSDTGPTYSRRQWDIKGRRYFDTFPVDFHLSIFGEVDMGDHPTAGKTRIEGTLQSATFNETSEENLQDASDELSAILKHAIERQHEEEIMLIGGSHG